MRHGGTLIMAACCEGNIVEEMGTVMSYGAVMSHQRDPTPLIQGDFVAYFQTGEMKSVKANVILR